jgi:tyrocidine synthetase-3
MMKVSEKQAVAAAQQIKERGFWLEAMAGDLQKQGIPYDFPVQDHRLTASKRLGFHLNETVSGRLLHMSGPSDEALHMIVTAGLLLLLHRYSGVGDITIGAPIYKQAGDGELINTVLPLRIRFSPVSSFKEILLSVRQTLSDAMEHADYPIAVLTRQLGLEAEDGLCPLFDVGVCLPAIHSPDDLKPAPHPMTFRFNRSGRSVACDVFFMEVYEEATIRRVFGQLEYFLQEALTAVDTPLAQLSPIPPLERQEIVENFNRTEAAYPNQSTIQQLFSRVAGDFPGNTAIIHGDDALSYSQLDQKSDALAQRLREKGVGRDHIVAILAERSTATVCAILAVLKARGAYLPIDPVIPAERVLFMLKDSGASIVLTERHLRPKAGDSVLTLDLQDPDIFKNNGGSVEHVNRPEDLAYVIYTSGSTGTPKGVMLEHRGVVNYIHWAIAQYVRGESCVFPLYTSISFDLTVTSIFVPLLSGNTIAVFPENEGELAIQQVMEDERINVVKLTPAHLKLVEQRKYKPAGLKRMILGGENLETSIAASVFEHMNRRVDIYNEYGPTETVVGCMIHRFDPEKDNGTSVSIGGPIQNTAIYLLNGDLKPVPNGAVGELFIAGEGVARGYLNRPELTNETFLANPLANAVMYRSGDLARRKNNGGIEFLGRVDHQVKIRGYRIEGGDIEAHIKGRPGVTDAVVLPLEDHDGDLFLCAYVVQQETMTAEEWHDHLEPLLPSYMIPQFFVTVDAIPLTANGKVDRQALPKPRLDGEDVPYAAPRNQHERQLAALWADVLGMEEEGIGIDHNFFALGGQSLKGARLVSMILDRMNIDVPLVELFRRRTIRQLAEFTAGASANAGHMELEPAPLQDDYPLTSGQQRLYSLQQLDPQSTAYNMPVAVWLEGEPDRERLKRAVEELVKRHESLRTYVVMKGEEPRQKILPPSAANIHIEETENQESPQDFIRPFKLDQAPLMRVRLSRHEASRYLLMMDIHHIVFDGVSQGILVQDFIALYKEESLPPLEFHYKDWAFRQHDSDGRDNLQKQEEFWLRQFPSAPQPLEIPTDFSRPRIMDFAGRNLRFDIGPEQTAALRALAIQEGTTLYMVLLAVLNILFHKLSGQEDIVIGAGVAGRNHPKLEGIIGMFVNTLPLRNFPSAGNTFRQFLAKVSEGALSAFENQDYKLEDLVRQVVAVRDQSRNPLFDTVFVFNNFDPQPVRLPGLTISPYGFDVTIAKFDLSFYCNEAGDGLAFSLEYRTSLFIEETVRQFAGYVEEIVAAVIEDPDISLKDIAVSHQLLEATVAATSDDFTTFDF